MPFPRLDQAPIHDFDDDMPSPPPSGEQDHSSEDGNEKNYFDFMQEDEPDRFDTPRFDDLQPESSMDQIIEEAKCQDTFSGKLYKVSLFPRMPKPHILHQSLT